MRLALLSDGANVHTRRWTGYFADRGDELLLLTLEDPSGMPVPSLRLGPRIPPKMLAYSLAVPAARRALDRFAPDLVNAHFVPNYGWMAHLLGRRPWVMSTWGSDVLVNPGRSPFHRWRARRVMRAADLLTSDAVMLTDAIQELAGPELPVLTAPMGIDRALHETGETSSPRKPVILHNRNLESVYDVHTVLRGFMGFSQLFPDWRLRLAGDGSQRAELERLATSLGLGDRVLFLGRLNREELMEELRRATVYLSASLSDSTSVSLLEAMSLGAYPVLSDIPANREWIPGRPHGEYFIPGRSQALTRALLEAIALPEQARREATEANRREIGARAIWEENMAGLRDHFVELAERGAPS
jgi:L-malate glycosyltransferase